MREATAGVEVGPARVIFDVAGDGEAVVFIHAGIADRTMWDPQFGLLGARYRVLRFDVPNFGESTIGAGRFSPVELVEAVMEAARVGRSILVGCSLGGGIALDTALQRPSRVAGLVLVGAAVGGRRAAPEAAAEMRRVDELRAAGDLDAFVDGYERLFVTGPGRPRSQVDPAFLGRARRWLEAIAARPWPDGVDLERVSPPAADRLAEISVPTLVVVGDADVPTIVDASRELAAGIPGAQFEVIQNAAHLPSVERPERFNELLVSFLARPAQKR